MPSYSFPPDWVTRPVALYLTSLTRDQFDAYMRAGLLPGPVKHGNKELWDRQGLNQALAGLSSNATIAPDDDIMKAAAGDGATKKDRRRGLAAVHP